jgi:cyclopropane-fatty-acyl-phospholipid synthase
MKVLETASALPSKTGPGLARFIRNRVVARLSGLRGGLIIAQDPWGEWTAGDEHHGHCINITVHNTGFYRKLLLGGSNAAARAYMNGDWSCDDLTGLLRLFLHNMQLMDELENSAGIANILYSTLHYLNRNSLRGSKDNIHAHYDLGNDLFALFLDETMTYSSGIYPRADSTLKEASIEKLDRICRKLNLDASMHILEIGSGWGSFALHAAGKFGCRVTTTTISRQQYDYVAGKIRDAGLEDRITLQLEDYRDLQGKYDRLVSIEMLEAVGHRFLPVYFRKCSELLKVDGQMLIQVITMPDHRYKDYLSRSDFIQQFIFPGSCCPSLNAVSCAATAGSDMKISHLEDIGEHYATTLAEWRHNFRTREQEVLGLGYDTRFIRLWEYYLCYCEAGFRERYSGDLQIVFNKPGCRSSVNY